MTWIRVTTHWVVSNGNLRQVSVPDVVLELCMAAYACE